MRQRIEQAIAELTLQNGRPPTNREIGAKVGGATAKSTGHIDYHLRYMREQGVISHEPRKSRGITLLNGGLAPSTGIAPLRIRLAGQIAAGRAIEATEVQDDYVDLTDGLEFGSNVFALRVKGTSMIDDHIDDGDLVIVRRQETADNGDTVVALLVDGNNDRGEATLKRFYREKGGKIRLQPRNPEMEPIIKDSRDVRIQGKVITVIRHV
jgi:SOS regulatory protein LexA